MNDLTARLFKNLSVLLADEPVVDHQKLIDVVDEYLGMPRWQDADRLQLVAQLELKGFGNAFLHADGIGFFWLPSALHDLVVGRRLRGVRDIKFPLNQALGALVGVALGANIFTIDLNQSPPNHGVPVPFGYTRFIQGL